MLIGSLPFIIIVIVTIQTFQIKPFNRFGFNTGIAKEHTENHSTADTNTDGEQIR